MLIVLPFSEVLPFSAASALYNTCCCCTSFTESRLSFPPLACRNVNYALHNTIGRSGLPAPVCTPKTERFCLLCS